MPSHPFAAESSSNLTYSSLINYIAPVPTSAPVPFNESFYSVPTDTPFSTLISDIPNIPNMEENQAESVRDIEGEKLLLFRLVP
jgi:hypothetical protein